MTARSGEYTTNFDFRAFRERLAAQRRAGATFKAAWARALVGVYDEDRSALEATAWAWREAFYRRSVWGADAVEVLRASLAQEPASPTSRPPTRLPLPHHTREMQGRGA